MNKTMSEKFKIVTDGGDVWFKLLSGNIGKARKEITKRYPICPFCLEKIKDPEKDVYLILSGWKLFPNVFVHKECCDDPKCDIEFLKNNYENYVIKLKEVKQSGWADYQLLDIE